MDRGACQAIVHGVAKSRTLQFCFQVYLVANYVLKPISDSILSFLKKSKCVCVTILFFLHYSLRLVGRTTFK